MSEVLTLARDLVSIDSRSFVSTLPVMERLEQELHGFQVERVDYEDEHGVAKRSLVAYRGDGAPALAFSGHLDTVPDTGWVRDPFVPTVANGRLHGLGSTDMKGPVAAMTRAVLDNPELPAMLIITADEEIGKAGARSVVERSHLLREHPPVALVIGEPTRLRCVRGHKANVSFTVEAHGIQAHSSTGEGVNANIQLLPFLMTVRDWAIRLREEPQWRDPGYQPPYPDFNFVIDNHGTAPNVTCALATCRIKFRYSRGNDPEPVVNAMAAAAEAQGLHLTMLRDGRPPELPEEHPLVRLGAELSGAPAITVPFGTDASVLQALCPVIVMGPGDIDDAHKPTEKLAVAELETAVERYGELLRRVADGALDS